MSNLKISRRDKRKGGGWGGLKCHIFQKCIKEKAEEMTLHKDTKTFDKQKEADYPGAIYGGGGRMWADASNPRGKGDKRK